MRNCHASYSFLTGSSECCSSLIIQQETNTRNIDDVRERTWRPIPLMISVEDEWVGHQVSEKESESSERRGGMMMVVVMIMMNGVTKTLRTGHTELRRRNREKRILRHRTTNLKKEWKLKWRRTHASRKDTFHHWWRTFSNNENINKPK